MRRPLDERTRQRLIDLRAANVPMHRIELVLDIPENTLRKRYPDIFADQQQKEGKKLWDPSPKEIQQIEIMAGLGMNFRQIGLVMGVDPRRMKAAIPEVIQRAALVMDMRVGANLYKMATGDVTQKNTAAAAIWWTKARMGWRDTSRIETTGADGGPVQSQVQILLPDNGREDTPMIDGKVELDDGEAGGDSDDANDEATDEELADDLNDPDDRDAE